MAPLAGPLLFAGSPARFGSWLSLSHPVPGRHAHAAGLGFFAVLWFGTGLLAYRTNRRGDVAAHRRWMTRNFALTLAAVTVRNYLPLMLFALLWSVHVVFIIVSWLCWVRNFLVAEWFVRRQPRIL